LIPNSPDKLIIDIARDIAAAPGSIKASKRKLSLLIHAHKQQPGTENCLVNKRAKRTKEILLLTIGGCKLSPN
jgi:hypothetical protein